MLDSWVTRKQAAVVAKVTEDVVKSWRYRGWIGEDGQRHYLRVLDGKYLLGDVLHAERDTRRKSRYSHRRKPPATLDAQCHAAA